MKCLKLLSSKWIYTKMSSGIFKGGGGREVGNSHFRACIWNQVLSLLGESLKPLYMSQGREKKQRDFLILWWRAGVRRGLQGLVLRIKGPRSFPPREFPMVQPGFSVRRRKEVWK